MIYNRTHKPNYLLKVITMSNQAQAQKNPVGRPLTEKGARVKRAVIRAIEAHGSEGFTVAELARQIKQNRVTVNNHVNLMVQAGKLQRADVVKSGGRGRPQRVYRVPAE